MRLLDFPDTARQNAASGLVGEATIEAAFGPAALEGHGFMTTQFAPGAHTQWHRHPLGQVLIVSRGAGYVQIDGFPAQRLHQGDIVQIPPGCLHWHGADSETSMVQITITDALAGVAVEWGDIRRPTGVDAVLSDQADDAQRHDGDADQTLQRAA